MAQIKMREFRQIDVDVIPVLVRIEGTVVRQGNLKGCRLLGARRVVGRGLRLDLFFPAGQIEDFVLVSRLLGEFVVLRRANIHVPLIRRYFAVKQDTSSGRLGSASGEFARASVECPSTAPLVANVFVVARMLPGRSPSSLQDLFHCDVSARAGDGNSVVP